MCGAVKGRLIETRGLSKIIAWRRSHSRIALWHGAKGHSRLLLPRFNRAARTVWKAACSSIEVGYDVDVWSWPGTPLKKWNRVLGARPMKRHTAIAFATLVLCRPRSGFS